MAKSAKPHYSGEKAAEEQQKAVETAKKQKFANERGEGNSLNNGEIIEIPDNLDSIIWMRPWKLDNGFSGNATMLDLVTREGREIAISTNYLFQPIREQNGTEKPKLPKDHPMHSVASRFRYGYDFWAFLSWVGVTYPTTALQVQVVQKSRYDWGKTTPNDPSDYRACTLIGLPVGVTLETLLVTWQSQHTDVSLRPAVTA
jgi:hypothetical protein